MKQSILNIWHLHRSRWHWNRMKVIAAAKGGSHNHLMIVDAAYYRHSIRYNQSKDWLVDHADYVTATSLIAK